MKRTRPVWWGMVRGMIRSYPILRARKQGEKPGPFGWEEQKRLEAVERAVQRLRGTQNGEELLKLIRLMYWCPRPMPGKSAALHLDISEITAKRWHGAFVRMVARNYGFPEAEPRYAKKVTKDDTPEANKCAIITSGGEESPF